MLAFCCPIPRNYITITTIPFYICCRCCTKDINGKELGTDGVRGGRAILPPPYVIIVGTNVLVDFPTMGTLDYLVRRWCSDPLVPPQFSAFPPGLRGLG